MEPRRRRWLVWMFWLLLAAATFVAYGPALQGGFVSDDMVWATLNTNIHRGTLGLGEMWTNPRALQQYYPLTGTTFWVDAHLWKSWTLPFHVENVVLHLTSAMLLWCVLGRFRVQGGWLAASIFALHPVMVESVAWISERKNLLSLCWCLGALWAYGWFLNYWTPPRSEGSAGGEGKGRRMAAYGVSLLFFLAALLSKTTTATLPAVILVIAWWKRGRIRWRADLVPTIPFFVLAIGFGLLVAWLEKHNVRATGPEFAYSPAERCLIAGRGFWFYVGKLLWPVDLCFVYPLWHPDSGSLSQWLYPLLAIALVLVLWVSRGRIGRGPVAAALIFGGTLLPFLGFINGYFMVFSFVWDHLVYLPSVGLIAGVAAAVLRASERFQLARAPVVFACMTLPMLALLTWRHSFIFSDEDTLFRATLALNPGSAMIHQALGGNLLAKGQVDEAIVHYEKCLETRPLDVPALNGLGVAFVRRGQPEQAMAQFEKIVSIEPNNVKANSNLGNLLLSQGRVDEAIRHYQIALEADPDDVSARYNLANALIEQKRFADAVEQLQAAYKIQPGNVWIVDLLARLLATAPDAAVRDGEQAVKLAEQADALAGGNDPRIHADLAAALAETGRFTEAQATAEQALQLALARTNVAAAELLRRQIELYRAGKPFHEPGLTNAPAR